MRDHLESLKKYVANDFTYNRFKSNPNEYFNGFELICIEHVEDIQWAIDELIALYTLVAEMRKKYGK